MIKITCLERIYKEMRRQQLSQCVIPYCRKNVRFSVIFDTKSIPYVLYFGVVNQNLSFSFKVRPGFIIENAYLEKNKYDLLVKILKLEYDPNNKFSPRAFLESFDEAVPHHFKISQPTYKNRSVIFRNVEEPDKIYFQKWLSHDKDGRNVTEQNLEKTRKWLGERDYYFCKRNNISTCWTADAEKAQDPDRMHPENGKSELS